MPRLNLKRRYCSVGIVLLLVCALWQTAALSLFADDAVQTPDGTDLVFRAYIPLVAQGATFAAAEVDATPATDESVEEDAFIDVVLVEEDDNDNYVNESSLVEEQTEGDVSAAGNKKVRYDDLADSGDYTLSGRKWNKLRLTYYFQNGTNDIAGTGEKTAIKQAFALWAAVVLRDGRRLSFVEVSSASTADIIIRFAVGNHGDGSSFDGVNGVLAHAFYPPPNGGAIAGDAHFDDSESWTSSTRTNSAQPIDLVTVAAHEIGHSLGLGHSSISTALMAPFYTGSHRFLSTDDINGIRAIYP